MATVKITEKPLVTPSSEECNFLITQPESINGAKVEVVRRANIQAVAAALKLAGFIGGLAFDEVSFDSKTGYLHIKLKGEDVVDPCYIGVGDGRGVSETYVEEAIKKHNESENAHPTLQTGGSGGICKSISVLVQSDDWVEYEEPVNGYTYYCDISDEEITEEMTPVVVLDEASLEAAKICGLCPTATSYDGYVRLKCDERPNEEISAVCHLMGTGGATVAGDIASDEDVTKILAETFGSGAVASNDEVTKTIVDIFGVEP